MFCRSMLLAVVGLFLSGCVVYDYDGYSGYPRYYYRGDYLIHLYDGPPVFYPYYLSDHRRFDRHRHDFRRFDHRMDHRFDRRFDDRMDHRFDRRFDDRMDHRFDRRFDNRMDHRFDRRFDRRFDNFHERRHNFTPRLRTWGQNDRQQFQVQPGYMVQLRDNRSGWSLKSRY